ncbi:hypothetical protein [Streptomyces sp. NPDC093970]|uniref:hypothetical protein n=1 Tax=Streptomyces sp. NPDC093970 TaxID=3155076 RepID=UPI003415C8F7
MAPRLAAATEDYVWRPALPGLVAIATEVVEGVDADLGFRLFLRMLNASDLSVGLRDHQGAACPERTAKLPR